MVLLGYLVLKCVPFSTDIGLSLHSFVKLLHVFAAAFAIPVIFDTRRKIEGAMFYSAVGISLILALDLQRLVMILGLDLMSQARFERPYVMGHPNVASMLSAASVFILAHFAWMRRKRPVVALLSVAGVVGNLVYILAIASRGPQVALFVSSCIFGLLFAGLRQKLLWLLLLTVAASLALANIGRVAPRFLDGNTGTLNERKSVWEHTAKLCGERPLLGFGFGKEVFRKVYYSSDYPKSEFRYPHPHRYWLKARFESGRLGMLLHLAAWLSLGMRLLIHIFRQPTFSQRSLPGTVAAILITIFVYGAVDYPDNLVRIMQIWLIPVALVLTGKRDANGRL